MSVLIDLVTRRWLEDIPGTEHDPENGVFNVQLAAGFVHPGLDEDGVTTIETATQLELDGRALFVARQGLVDAAKEKLAVLRTEHKELDLGLDILEAITVRLGKASYLRSKALEDADLTTRRAHETFVAAAPTANATQLRDLLITLCTALGTQDEAKRKAEIAYQADLSALKQAIDARDPPSPLR